ncbi:MAG TPA: hypothetical protein VN580_07120, partial [Clostridia bacterium]|nr:hypothetical protein [Clostridia bacterium]
VMTIILLCLSCNIAVFADPPKAASKGVIHSGEIKPEGEVWTAEDGPHIVQYTFQVGGPTAPVLVIEPGALVLFDSGAEIRVGWIGPGGLMVNGTPEAPVRFEANTSAVHPGYYWGINFWDNTIPGKAYIRNASIQSAGSSGSADMGAITLGHHSKPTTCVELTNVEIKNCMRYGLRIHQDSKLAPNSSNVSVMGTVPLEGKGGYAISTDLPGSNALPVGGTFMNNYRNAIQLLGYMNPVNENLLWRNLGIPYVSDWSIEVGGNNNPVFTIEPGVVALFGPGQWIQVGWNGKGSIVADARPEQTFIEAVKPADSGLSGQNQGDAVKMPYPGSTMEKPPAEAANPVGNELNGQGQEPGAELEPVAKQEIPPAGAANTADKGSNKQVLEAALQLASPDAMLDKSLELLKRNKAIVFGTLGDPLQKGSWYGIRLLEGSVSGNIFNGCVISGAGIPDGYEGRGGLSAKSSQEAAFKVANTLISGSASSGLDLIGKVSLTPDSLGNIFKNNEFPARVSPYAAGSLLPGTEILDNVNDIIQVFNGSASTLQADIIKSATWASLGVPYFIQDPFNIDGSFKEAVLTLSKGITMTFGSGSGINIGKLGPGSLIALGTVIDPVTFTSFLGAAGSWNGLHFFELAGPSSMMDGILLEHAVTGITFEAVPGVDILKNSTIRLCEMFGIEQKYVDLVKKLLNFLLPGLGNHFEDNGQDQNKKGKDE